MRTTIKDIALKAGVSKTTVSFAFNDSSKISKDTYNRIMQIAQELGYVPDPVARILTTKKIGAFGFLLPQPIHEAMKNPYMFQIVQGIGEVCHELDFSLTIIPPSKGCIANAVRRAAVDGFITVGVGPDAALGELFQQRRIPYVTIDGESTQFASNIGIDDKQAAYSLMQYILSEGHRKIAIVQLKSATMTLPEEHFSRVLDMRILGFREAFESLSLSFDNPLVRVYSSESSIQGGAEIAKAILENNTNPTVIICMSDIAAIGVYYYCKTIGLKIPQDISITGFDDIPESCVLTPSLTTVRQPSYEKGRIAAKLMIDAMSQKPISNITLTTELIIRDSVRKL